MSDTTKIDKIRVNGVVYDLAGSGSGGGISGLYTAPLDLMEVDYKGFEYAAVDPMALIEQLEKAGINVDEPPIMDSDEDSVDFNIGSVRVVDLNSGNNDTNLRSSKNLSGSYSIPLIDILLTRNSSFDPNLYDLQIDIYGVGFTGLMGVDALNRSLRQIIIDYFTQYPDLYIELPYHDSNKLGYIVNSLDVYQETVNTTLRYYISNLTEFCDNVFIKYESGSDSGSGYEPVPPAVAM